MRRRLALLWTLLAASIVSGAAAQERMVIVSEPGTPVIATEILLATGPADEGPDRAGLAHVAARAVTAPIRPMLDSLDAHLRVTALKDAVSFSLVAAPDAWEAASRMLLLALLRDPVNPDAVAREQRAIRAELVSRRTNPADAVAREMDAALYGPAHPWGRPAVGEPETVAALSAAAVDGFLRAHFTADRAVVAVVGPVDPTLARAHLESFIPATEPLEVTRVPAPPPADELVRRDYNAITTWVSSSFPVPDEADEEVLRFLAHAVAEELAFGPTRRSVYDARGELSLRRGGGELRFTVVIPPQEADAWAERIEDVLRNVGERTSAEEFRRRVRRYRGERLLGLDAPEDRAHEAARRLFVTGRSGDPVPELENLTLARLRAAVQALGEPTVVFLGPFLDDSGI